VKIIGVAGTNGSGKDTIGQILAENHGWLFISGSDMLRDELKKRNLPIERENLRNLSAEWRREHGLGIIIDKVVEKFQNENVDGKYKGLVTVSLRNPGEADRIHELGGQVVWTDADPKVRYQRIVQRQRGSEDLKSFELFLAEEQAEMSHSGDEATLNMAGVQDRADIFIVNNQNDLEVFKNQVEHALAKILV
jgi:dephospho-CoA kinase